MDNFSVPEGLVAKCVANAEALRTDAAILAEQRRYPRAVAIAVLSFEEFAKAWLYRAMEIGFAAFLPENDSSAAKLLLCSHVMERHRSKHNLVRVCLLGARFLPPGKKFPALPPNPDPAKLEEARKELGLKGPKSWDSFLPEHLRPANLPKLREKVRHDRGEQVELKRIHHRVSHLETLKQDALYVDVRGTKVKDPSAICPADYKRVVEDMEAWLRVNGNFLAPLDPAYIPLLRDFVATSPFPRMEFRCENCERDHRRGRRGTPASVSPTTPAASSIL